MIDINIIRAGNKTYSVKTKIDTSDDEMSVIILNVDEVSLRSNTSYTKLKTIWTNPTGNSQFETIKYNEIYQAIIKRLISKYKMKKLVI
jgi:hypothetical protein